MSSFPGSRTQPEMPSPRQVWSSPSTGTWLRSKVWNLAQGRPATAAIRNWRDHVVHFHLRFLPVPRTISSTSPQILQQSGFVSVRAGATRCERKGGRASAYTLNDLQTGSPLAPVLARRCDPLRRGARGCDGADDEIRTRDIQLGKLTGGVVSLWGGERWKTAHPKSAVSPAPFASRWGTRGCDGGAPDLPSIARSARPCDRISHDTNPAKQLPLPAGLIGRPPPPRCSGSPGTPPPPRHPRSGPGA